MSILSRLRRKPDQPEAPVADAEPADQSDLDSDRPIRTAKQDEMGRGPLAKAIAVDLLTAPGDIVAAITGPWGSGKTSVLNLVKAEIEDARANGEKILVIDFNAWYFSGTEQLIQHFFAEMRAKLASRNDKALAVLGDQLEAYGARVAPFGNVPLIGDAARAIAATTSTSGRIAKGRARFTGTLEKQRKDVEEALGKTSYRFLIVLDDIDRLEDTEIRDIVRLVRLVAHFPRTSYLLAFDRPRVEKALGLGEQQLGRDYLEKIVQLDYPLPPPSRSEVAMLAFRAIDAAIVKLEHRSLDPGYWANIRTYVVEPLLRTPRDAKRYAKLHSCRPAHSRDRG